MAASRRRDNSGTGRFTRGITDRIRALAPSGSTSTASTPTPSTSSQVSTSATSTQQPSQSNRGRSWGRFFPDLRSGDGNGQQQASGSHSRSSSRTGSVSARTSSNTSTASSEATTPRQRTLRSSRPTGLASTNSASSDAEMTEVVRSPSTRWRSSFGLDRQHDDNTPSPTSSTASSRQTITATANTDLPGMVRNNLVLASQPITRRGSSGAATLVPASNPAPNLIRSTSMYQQQRSTASSGSNTTTLTTTVVPQATVPPPPWLLPMYSFSSGASTGVPSDEDEMEQ